MNIASTIGVVVALMTPARPGRRLYLARRLWHGVGVDQQISGGED